jgi:hypothetical protein
VAFAGGQLSACNLSRNQPVGPEVLRDLVSKGREVCAQVDVIMRKQLVLEEEEFVL